MRLRVDPSVLERARAVSLRLRGPTTAGQPVQHRQHPGSAGRAHPVAPVRAANSTFVWFTHGHNISGFPGVRWGGINIANNTVQATNAFHSGTSDDFNLSLGAFEVAANSLYIWLNWAYTDTSATPCANTSTTVNGVAPGGDPRLGRHRPHPGHRFEHRQPTVR